MMNTVIKKLPFNFRTTLDNKEWKEKNLPVIKRIFPETWTHTANIDFLKIRFQLKLIGFDYRSDDEVAAILARLEKEKIVLRDGELLRRAQ